MEDKKESGLLELGGLWLNESKNGEKYFGGKINNLNVLVMKNKYKEEGTKQPDYKIFLSKPQKKKEEETSNEDAGWV